MPTEPRSDPLLDRLEAKRAVLLVVDVQEKLMPAIADGAQVLDTVRRVVEAMDVLGVPKLVTEQYPAGLGRTCPPVANALGDAPVVDKTCFSACVDPILKHLKDLARPQVLVAGVEAHVCVQQTVLDLLRRGYRPYVLADAVGSRRPFDRDIALHRLRQAGAVVTTAESAIFELLGAAGGEAFKRVLKIVK